jgi:hypothetical protein
VDSSRAVDFLLRLQESGFGVWVAESNWAYPGILTLHTAGLALLVGPTAFVDFRVLGMGAGVPLAPLERLSRVRWTGLALNVTTGLALFVAAAAEKGVQTIFYAKLSLIALALLIDGRLWRRVFREGVESDPPLTPATRRFAATSLLLWAGAILAGRLMAYV